MVYLRTPLPSDELARNFNVAPVSDVRFFELSAICRYKKCFCRNEIVTDRANLVFAKLFGLQNSFSVFVRVFLFGIRLGADFDLVGTQKVG